MPDLRRLLSRGLGATLIAGLCAAVPASAAPGSEIDDLRVSLDLLERIAVDPARIDQSAAALLFEAGLTDRLRPTAPPGPILSAPETRKSRETVEAQPLDMRLALTMLTQTAGATDTRAVMTAQSSPTLRALVVRKGDATLADLAVFLRQYRLQDVTPGAPLVVQVPIVIWDGASLRLDPGETLVFSRADGAFLVNFGHLAVNGATVRATVEPNPRLPRFAPFVTTTGRGTLQVTASRFEGLGFGKTLSFAGFSVIRNNMMVVRERSFVRDSQFRDLVSVAFSAANDVVVEGNRFQDARGPALVMVGSARARILSNLFAGKAAFNSIQVLDGSVDAVISGNLVLGGEKTGIVVRKKSRRPYVANNIVVRRQGGGITVERADCASILSNTVLGNTQKGIEVRSSNGSLVRDNLVIDNASAGIWISAQKRDARTFVLRNVLLANRAGLSTATAENVVLEGNDFTGQFPRFLGGDVSAQSVHIASDLGGATPLMLTGAGVSNVPADAASCGVIGG